VERCLVGIRVYDEAGTKESRQLVKPIRRNRESPIRVRQAQSTFHPQGSCECCDFVQEGYPRHPKGALLAKQLQNVN